MLLEQIKGFYHGITKIFLLVGSYTMAFLKMFIYLFLFYLKALQCRALMVHWYPVPVAKIVHT